MRYIHSKYSVENIWNCEESPEKDSTKQHAQYANCMKEKQINNGQIIILYAIIEKQGQSHKNAYLLMLIQWNALINYGWKTA